MVFFVFHQLPKFIDFGKVKSQNVLELISIQGDSEVGF